MAVRPSPAFAVPELIYSRATFTALVPEAEDESLGSFLGSGRDVVMISPAQKFRISAGPNKR